MNEHSILDLEAAGSQIADAIAAEIRAARALYAVADLSLAAEAATRATATAETAFIEAQYALADLRGRQ